MGDFVVEPHWDVGGLTFVVGIALLWLVCLECIIQPVSVLRGKRVRGDVFAKIWRDDVACPADDELLMSRAERTDAGDHGGVSIAGVDGPCSEGGVCWWGWWGAD